MPPFSISDRSLGMQMWMTQDVKSLRQEYDAVRIQGADHTTEADRSQEISYEKKGKIVSGKANMTALASAAESKHLRNVEGKAKLLGSLLNAQGDVVENGVRTRTAFASERFRVDFDVTVLEIARLSRKFSTTKLDEKGNEVKLTGPITEEELGFARRALEVTLLSCEFTARAHESREIGEEARLSLINASLGMMNLIREGKLTDAAAADILQGEVFDPGKPIDLLRLATKTAQTARATFIDAQNLEATRDAALAELDRALAKEGLDPADRTRLVELKDRIVRQTFEVISRREAASKRLDLTFDAGNPNDKTYKLQLRFAIKRASNAMRGWRYDMDKAAGRLGGRMERFRRRLDNLGRKGENRVSAQQFNGLVEADDELTRLLADCRQTVGALAPSPDGPANLTFTSVRDTSLTAEHATHATNNYVRAYFSGNAKAAQFSAEVHEMFDSFVEKGGSKYVEFEVGGSIGGDVSIAGQGVTLQAQGKYYQRALISVAPGGGEVKVTYLKGGAVGLEAEAKLGISDSVKAEAEAHAEIGGAKGRTVTYRSLDDFIRDTHGKTELTRGLGGTLACLGKIVQGIRAIGHGFRSLMETFGFVGKRIEQLSRDNRVQLKRTGVLGKLDTMLSGVTTGNAVKTSERKFGLFQMDGGLGEKVNIGVSNAVKLVSVEASTELKYERERHVEGREMKAYLDVVSGQSDDWVAQRVIEIENEDPEWSIRYEADATTEQAFSRLEALVQKLHAQVDEKLLGNPPDDRVKEVGRETCGIVRKLAVQYESIVRVMKYDLAAAERAGNEAEVARLKDLIATADEVYGEQLRATDFGIPQEVFEEELMVDTGHVASEHSVHSMNFTVAYDAASEMTDSIVDNTPKLQAAEGDNYGITFLKSLGSTAESQALSNGLELAGLKGEVEVTVTDRVPRDPKTDRPWCGHDQTTISLRVTPSLPFRVILEQTVGRYIKSHGGGDLQKAQEMTGEIVSAFLVSALPSTLIVPPVTLLAKWALSKESFATFLGKVIAWNESNAVKVVGMDNLLKKMSYTKTLDVNFEDGRFTSLSLGDGTDVKSIVGLKFKAGPVKLGLHMSSRFNEDRLTRTVYPKPRFTTLLGKAAEFSRTDIPAKLDAFLACNSKGALRLLEGMRLLADNQPVPQDRDKDFRPDAAEANRLVENAAGRIRLLKYFHSAKFSAKELEAIRDRATQAESDLVAARQAFNELAPNAVDETKLAALANLLRATAACYELVHQSNRA